MTPASGVTRKEFINFMRRTVAACGQLLALDDSRAKWEETLGPVPVGEERLKYELHPPPAGDYVPYWRPIRGCLVGKGSPCKVTVKFCEAQDGTV